jgi:putative transposase
MKDDEDRRLAVATFRYGILAAALESHAGGVTEILRAAAARTHTDPDDDPVRITLSTLWRWLADYRRGGLLGLRPTPRTDRGCHRAVSDGVWERAERLRRELPRRATKTIIDILVRQQVVQRDDLARSTLDRYFDRAGLSRRALRTLGCETFGRIETAAVFELVVGDFHHGPYVRVGPDDEARRALYGGFIDHFSRYIPEARYYLREDFVALRFGFRRLLAAEGLPVTLFVDHGSAYQATRFHAACAALGIRLAQSKPYRAEARGVIERYHRTLKEQFESEVRSRETLPTLDELNAWFEAWLAERYHRDVHSETGAAPVDRFTPGAARRPAPAAELVDEYLRLRESRTVHRKWSTVEVAKQRFAVHPSLRGRRVHVLFDPCDLAYVLIAYDGRIVERALPQRPGAAPPAPEVPPAPGPPTDYLALLRADYERRVRTELAALHHQPPTTPELDLPGLVVRLERCRTVPLTDPERSLAAATWRQLRPLDAAVVGQALDHAQRRLGPGLHLRVYLDALQDHLVRTRARKGTPKP